MTIGVYAIVNKINGDRYIGGSRNIEHRIACHKSDLRKEVHKNRNLQAAWNLYGESCFELVVLEECLVTGLISLEQKYIDMGCEYNIDRKVIPSTIGMTGQRHTAETRQKMSETAKGHPVSEIARRKISDSHKNRTAEEHIERSRKISEKARGRKISEETRKKMSNSGKRKTIPENVRQKMRNAALGRIASEETKQKIKESWIRRKEKLANVLP